MRGKGDVIGVGFVKIPKMGTFRAQADSSRQHEESQLNNEYLGNPPADTSLTQVRNLKIGRDCY